MHDSQENADSKGYDGCQQITPQRASDFGSDFISLGSSRSGGYQRRGRGRSHWRNSGTRYVSHYSPRDNTTESPQWKHTSSPFNSPDSSSPMYYSPNSSSRSEQFTKRRSDGWSRNQMWNRNHQGGSRSDWCNDISNYYHPSMIQNPWKELEYLYADEACNVNNSKDTTSSDFSLLSQDCEDSVSHSSGSESPEPPS